MLILFTYLLNEPKDLNHSVNKILFRLSPSLISCFMTEDWTTKVKHNERRNWYKLSDSHYHFPFFCHSRRYAIRFLVQPAKIFLPMISSIISAKEDHLWATIPFKSASSEDALYVPFTRHLLEGKLQPISIPYRPWFTWE